MLPGGSEMTFFICAKGSDWTSSCYLSVPQALAGTTEDTREESSGVLWPWTSAKQDLGETWGGGAS